MWHFFSIYVYVWLWSRYIFIRLCLNSFPKLFFYMAFSVPTIFYHSWLQESIIKFWIHQEPSEKKMAVLWLINVWTQYSPSSPQFSHKWFNEDLVIFGFVNIFLNCPILYLCGLFPSLPFILTQSCPTSLYPLGSPANYRTSHYQPGQLLAAIEL